MLIEFEAPVALCCGGFIFRHLSKSLPFSQIHSKYFTDASPKGMLCSILRDILDKILMNMTLVKPTIVLCAALAISGCQSNSGSTSSPAMRVASQGTGGTANGDRFPSTISGGDGFQANPTNDASFATLINAVRLDAGSAPVAYNAKLDSAAQGHAQDMFANDYFSHDGLNGSDVGDRVTAAGYAWKYVAENIAQGQANENVAMNGWVKSAGHQANNINPVFEEFGLGRSGTGSNTRWVLVLAAPQ